MTLSSLKDKYTEKFVSRTPNSKRTFEVAREILPGGVGGNMKFMKPYPLYVRSAAGSTITDVDGNQYIDYVQGNGAIILGHSHPAVVAKTQRAISEGTIPVYATEAEVQLGKRIQTHMKHLRRVRFCNSGSEATMFACRVARAYTKKPKIGKFEGCYDGQTDVLLVSGQAGGLPDRAGPSNAPNSVPDSTGIPKPITDLVVTLPYNDIEATCQLIKNNSKELAAVIIEPVAVFGMGCVPADQQFIKALKEVTEEEDIMLIFDEVVTGFRLGLGGAADYYDVTPDLTALGKIIGGGLPIGAYGGREDIMEEMVTPTKSPTDIDKKVFQSGTFTANPVTVAAGLATIEELEKGGAYTHVDDLGERFRRGLRDLASDSRIPVQVTGTHSLLHTHFADFPIRNRRDALKADSGKMAAFQMGLMANGILVGSMHLAFLSTSHTRDHVEKTLEVSGNILKEIAAESSNS